MDFGPLDISTATWALATTTSWAKIDAENLGKSDRGSFQLARLFVSVDAIAAVDTQFTLYLALASADRATLYGLVPVTCTVAAGRKTAGTSGDYICTVSTGTRDLADLLGAMDDKKVNSSLAWFVGVPGGLPAGSAHVYVRGVFTPVV